MTNWCPSSEPGWIKELCHDPSPRVGDYHSRVGYSRCFGDVAVMSPLHIIMCLFLLAHVLQPRPPSDRVFSYRAHSLVAVVSLLLSGTFCFLFLERSATMAPYEVLSYGIAVLTWISFSIVALKKVVDRNYFLYLDTRFIMIFAGVGVIFRMRTVGIVFHDETSGYIAGNIAAAVLTFVLWLVSFFHWPEHLTAYESVATVEDDVENSTSTKSDGRGPVNPYLYSSWPSKLWYSWFDPILKIGYRRQLVASDVFELEPGMFTEEIRNEFQTAWEDQVERYKEKANVIWAVWAIHKGDLALAAVWKFVYDGISFAPPLLLNELLKWMQDSDDNKDSSNCNGYVLSALIVLVTILQPILENSYFYVVYRAGMKSRSALTDAVQRKSLRIHPRARDKHGSGAILNHMTSDAEMLEWVFNSLNYLWSAPIRIAVSLYLLYQLMGYACFVGFGALLVLFPVQGVASVRLRNFRKQAMVYCDERIKMISELVNGIRIVKFYSWEKSSLDQIHNVRRKELAEFFKLACTSAVNSTLFSLNPVILAVVTFSVFTIYGDLKPNVAFTMLNLLNIIRFPLLMLPGAISSVLEASVSLTRLSNFLHAEEVVPVQPAGKVTGTIVLTNATIQYDSKIKKSDGEADNKNTKETSDQSMSINAASAEQQVQSASASGVTQAPFALRNVSVEFKPGTLTCVIGQTGCGKSTLIDGIVGDVEMTSGTVTVDGQISFCAQQAWITNSTVEENILFGEPLDRSKLNRVVRACQLVPDIENWKGGLKQEIGERGLNLSGGQKQRVAIARAAYASSDIVLLDDPLSALDAKVGRLLFEECIDGMLKDRTRVLVTNQLQYLPRADWIIVLKNGLVADQGTYQQLVANSDVFAEFTRYTQAHHHDNDSSSSSDDENEMEHDSDKAKKEVLDDENRLVDEEKREEGTTLTWRHISSYAKAGGGVYLLYATFIIFSLNQVVAVMSNWWIAQWSSDNLHLSVRDYVLGYFFFGVAQAIVTFLTAVFLAFCCNRAARRLHEAMLDVLVHLPMAFFDSNPSGRIMNRVTKDQGGIDDGMAWQISICLSSIFNLLGTIGAVASAMPLFMVIALPVLFVFYWVQLYYRTSVRELKRLEAVTRSPIYSFFGETLAGVSVIRACRKQNQIMDKMATLLDHNQKFVLAETVANRWLNMRLECLGVVVVLAATFLSVAERSTLGAAMTGYALTYAFSVTANMSIIIFVVSEAEKSFTAVERVMEYCALPIERLHGTVCPPKEWPSSGGIQFTDVEMGYRSNLPSVLKGVTFDVKPGEKVGVIGRTGAGKSSLFLTLYRMIELRRGTISIDGVDIADLDLDRLRSNLAIIPQDPVLFIGTVRSNLDPFSKRTDEDLFTAMRRAHLEDLDLNASVSENGSNFSVGQRQLLCLARALLVDSKILVLDEATASVDPVTDRLVQDTIQREFVGRTLLIIAHRIYTVLDADRILVLEQGEVAEFGAPRELVEKEDGALLGFISQYGAESQAMIQQIRTGVMPDKK
eukprot:PhM_4_TR7594/c0_g1_i4/m.47713